MNRFSDFARYSLSPLAGKNSFKVSRFDPELSPNSRDTMSSDEEDEQLHRRIPAVESDEEEEEAEEDEEDDDDDEFNDVDSGAGSDDFELLELGETGAEFCQIGEFACTVPFELYDLSGLEDILSLDVWNEVLTEEEKFGLTQYLPDLDQFTFARTLKELLEGGNFHFGSPVKKLFEMLKGGLCEPRVAMYREGVRSFQKRKHYHFLRNHQNDMVSNLCQIRDAWVNCRGYSIEEKLRILNIMKSQKSLIYENMEEDLESNSSENEESADGLWGEKVKDKKKGAQKLGRNSLYRPGSNMEFPSRKPSAGLEVGKFGKKNAKGMLKLGGSKSQPSKEIMGQFPPAYHDLDMNSRLFGSAPPASRHQIAMGYDSGEAFRLRDRMRIDDHEDDDDAEDEIYRMGVQRDQNVTRSMMNKSRVLKPGKKHDQLTSDSLATGNYGRLPIPLKSDPYGYGRNRNANQVPEAKAFAAKPPRVRNSYDLPKKSKYTDNLQQFGVGDQMKSFKGRALQVALEDGEPVWHGKNHAQASSANTLLRAEDWNMRSKKWKAGRESPDSYKGYRAVSPQMDDRIMIPDFRAKASEGRIRPDFMPNGKSDKSALRAKKSYMRNEETESESSDQFDEDDEDMNPLIRSKSAYPSGIEGSHFPLLKSGLDARRAMFSRKETWENGLDFDGITRFSTKVGGSSELGHGPGYSSKAKQKSKMFNGIPSHISGARGFEDGSPFVLGQSKDDDDRRRINKFGKNGQLRGESGERLRKTSSSDRKQKGEVSHDYAFEEDDDLAESRSLADEIGLGRWGKKGSLEVHDRRDRSEALLQGCSSVTKKRKAKEEVMGISGMDDDSNRQLNMQHTDDLVSLKKKGKRKLEADTLTPDMVTSEPPAMEIGEMDVELETKPQKKPYTPITPTIHTGFSFSIIHLLSAIRMAMITPLLEESLELAKSGEDQNKSNDAATNGVASHENAGLDKTDHAAQPNVPSLTVQEIVNRVRSNPGDPCILETQEPLQDLVRGVLKIFSSKTAPLGIKGWKALVTYEKSTKSWSWIGPIAHALDHETVEEVTSPEYWGLPHKTLVKLVDSFANWLKSGQEILQQIGSLPAPPVSLMQCNLDEKERFRDLRAQKSLNTISPSSEEVRAYFRKEEVLRYLIPDRAFQYTAADGKKSIVAPLRRCGGKPTSKARDHFMLKRDRPPHVTILCLVRDAAARLPGSIGTRADVCTLIRDSQYIVEDVSDAQVNQVVSGALDRLHYERDPCVQFDGERKLWVYLHREREDEDFEDDGTSSTKKWKRPKKDPAEQSDQGGAVTLAFHETPDQSGFELGSDLNVEPLGTDDDKITELVYNDTRQIVEDTVDTSHVSEHENTNQGQAMVWEPPLDLIPLPENKLLCQENSTNDDFDDESYGRERPVGLLNASLLRHAHAASSEHNSREPPTPSLLLPAVAVSSHRRCHARTTAQTIGRRRPDEGSSCRRQTPPPAAPSSAAVPSVAFAVASSLHRRRAVASSLPRATSRATAVCNPPRGEQTRLRRSRPRCGSRVTG
ncbi:hypothetical protein Tsubulata_009313 [Turnera subulata]|uniref:DEUBAD domain-containing protein n=1 Tax=Turnera subulata TaxID=218843 RepID=A0A9Q0FIG8_9ROSI|nr:hypothetical protein Tsubulata_009313 [Turnera subulata]